jgi:hypothetical protein
VLAAAGAAFAIRVVTYFLGLLTTGAHVRVGWVLVGLGGGGGRGGAEDSKSGFGVGASCSSGGAHISLNPGQESLY